MDKYETIIEKVNKAAENDNTTIGQALRTRAMMQDMQPMVYLELLKVDTLQQIANELHELNGKK